MKTKFIILHAILLLIAVGLLSGNKEVQISTLLGSVMAVATYAMFTVYGVDDLCTGIMMFLIFIIVIAMIDEGSIMGTIDSMSMMIVLSFTVGCLLYKLFPVKFIDPEEQSKPKT